MDLTDKNSNGYIEQGEGLKNFTVKYGNADRGQVNIFGNNTEANDGKLSEKEILDYYYLNIRFKDDITEEIETALEDYLLANNIFPSWIDQDLNSTGVGDIEESLPELLKPWVTCLTQ